MEFIIEHFVEILFGLISAGSLGFCKYLNGQIKEYKKLLELRETENINKAIDQKIQPVKTELEKKIELVLDKVEELNFSTQEAIREIKGKVDEVEQEERMHIRRIVRSWRFRIIQLCELYMEQGFITKAQFTQLAEMYSLYKSLGGNGQVTDYYEKAKALEVVHE
jgi:hypothetical protein